MALDLTTIKGDITMATLATIYYAAVTAETDYMEGTETTRYMEMTAMIH